MTPLNYPSFEEYKLPKKNILVISCMDLRLTDNLVHFLHFDNLHNRYDHFILAGTSLLTSDKHKDLFKGEVYTKYSHWSQTLHNHIELAMALHKVEDVYIVEHQDCGAYTNFLDSQKVDLYSSKKEKECHKLFAQDLADKIHQEYSLNTHCFFIDLRGNVELLYTKTMEN